MRFDTLNGVFRVGLAHPCQSRANCRVCTDETVNFVVHDRREPAIPFIYILVPVPDI